MLTNGTLVKKGNKMVRWCPEQKQAEEPQMAQAHFTKHIDGIRYWIGNRQVDEIWWLALQCDGSQTWNKNGFVHPGFVCTGNPIEILHDGMEISLYRSWLSDMHTLYAMEDNLLHQEQMLFEWVITPYREMNHEKYVKRASNYQTEYAADLNLHLFDEMAKEQRDFAAIAAYEEMESLKEQWESLRPAVQKGFMANMPKKALKKMHPALVHAGFAK